MQSRQKLPAGRYTGRQAAAGMQAECLVVEQQQQQEHEIPGTPVENHSIYCYI